MIHFFLYSFLITSKQPPRRTNACEHMNIMQSIIKRANPVGFARPPLSPNNPGLLVNNHSVVVKFLAFITGSFTTTRPVKMIE